MNPFWDQYTVTIAVLLVVGLLTMLAFSGVLR